MDCFCPSGDIRRWKEGNMFSGGKEQPIWGNYAKTKRANHYSLIDGWLNLLKKPQGKIAKKGEN